MSPEIDSASDKTPYIATQADIFSLGVLIFFLCTGKEDWKGKQLRIMSEKNLLQEIKLPNQYSNELRDLIISCLRFDPKERPTID